MAPFTPPATDLRQAFGLAQQGEIVALVGGGGKSSLLFALGRELAAAGSRVLGTTTTRMGRDQLEQAPAVCLLSDLPRLPHHLQEAGFCLLAGELGPDKISGVPLSLPAELLAQGMADVVIVEADGAKLLPIKAPQSHEPVLPQGLTLLIPVAGIDALDGPIASVAHRPELVSRLTGRSMDQPLQPEDVALLLTHPQGGLKDAPATGRIIPFINKVETEAEMARAERIARLAADHSRVQRVVVGAALHENVVRLVVEGREAGP